MKIVFFFILQGWELVETEQKNGELGEIDKLLFCEEDCEVV